MIYCNGDSHSNPNFYYPAMVQNTYADFVGQELRGFVLNKSINETCNRRIIRTSTHDLISQRQLNPNQRIIAVIGFTCESHGELWLDDINALHPEESNFVSQALVDVDTRSQGFFEDDTPQLQYNGQKIPVDENDFRQWHQGNRAFYNAYGQRINFLHDLLLFATLLKTLSIESVMFQTTPREKLVNEYLVDFYKTHLASHAIFDLEEFSFCDWCDQQGFEPLLANENRATAHYGPDAHQAFATECVLPKLL